MRQMDTPKLPDLREPVDLWEPYDLAAHAPGSNYHDPLYRAHLQEMDFDAQCSECNRFYGGPARGHNPGEQVIEHSPETVARGRIPEGRTGPNHGQCPDCYNKYYAGLVERYGQEKVDQLEKLIGRSKDAATGSES